MAVTTTVKTRALSIEVQSGVDKSGDAIYKKKTFSGVKTDAVPDACYNTAEAIKEVLAATTRNYFINDIEVMSANA